MARTKSKINQRKRKTATTLRKPANSESRRSEPRVAIATNVTDRVRSESELRRSEAYLAEAQRISHTGCWARNPTTGALFWSQEEWRIFGLDPKKTRLSYEMFLQMVHPEDRASLEEASTRAVREKRAYDIPFRIILPDGSIKHIHSVGKPFFEESGQVTEYIGVSMDVTERKRDEAALQLAQAELARVARQSVVNELSGSIAHELNQPLAAIMWNAEAALGRLDSDHPNLEVARRSLEDIVKEDARASEIVGRVRRMIKKEGGKFEPINIEKLLEATDVLMRSEFVRRRIVFEIDFPSGFPLVVGDFIQLQQVLVNLLMNAIEATKTSPPPKQTVVLRAEMNRATVKIMVSDNGPGIAEEVRNHLLEPFVTTKPDGLGLGLSICQTIARSHAGDISVENNPDGGVIAVLTLPVQSTDNTTA